MKEIQSEVRYKALRCLIAIRERGAYSNIITDRAASTLEDDRDRALLSSLVLGVTERKITLDYIIKTLAARSESDIDTDVNEILRLGIYQLKYMDRIPKRAAVCETVKLGKNASQRSFINAILRAYIRKENDIEFPKKEKNFARYLSVKYSFPRETCRFFLNLFGEDRTREYFEYFNSVPPLCLRVNTLKISRDDFISLLNEKITEKKSACCDSTVKKCASCDSAVIVESGAVRDIPGYSDGLFFVQDISSQTAVKVLGAREGSTVYDVCAAPGGKSFGIAMEMKNRGKVYSFDIHKSKLSLIDSGAGRLGIDIIKTAQRDASLPPKPSEYNDAEYVMCDVPCSGLGVLGKKADMRYRDIGSVKELPKLQYEILTQSAKLLKVGGELVYSTCTVNPAENEGVIDRFVLEHNSFEFVEFNADGGMRDGKHTFHPKLEEHDGFFISKIKRIK
ncbi:MAG: 16S rRNA (cytosine(967)-C(5))-methyltransferase RsmB [Eubacteriales bacterium]|nr:16S rRNA (cytosine(967)-C(5))-methyltransferase RsmB [Eubacteriales bacterium]